jgi:hypothetical protein
VGPPLLELLDVLEVLEAPAPVEDVLPVVAPDPSSSSDPQACNAATSETATAIDSWEARIAAPYPLQRSPNIVIEMGRSAGAEGARPT